VALTLLYDGDCGFCSRGAEWIRAHARDGAVTTEPISSPAGDRLLRDLGEAERLATWHVVDERGRRRSGGRAVAPVLRRLPGWRWLAPVAEAFPDAAELAYRVIARHRRTLGRVAKL
jgi:predicted DCC family thiol-disulfide oxidoreductase YuxK